MYIQFYDEKCYKDKDIEKLLKDCGELGMLNFDTYNGKYLKAGFYIKDGGLFKKIKSQNGVDKEIVYKTFVGKNEWGEEKYEWIQK